MRHVQLLLSALCFLSSASAYNNGLGRLPPMGWNTWCTDDICGLRDKCSDSLVREQADAMIDQGLDKLGYEYLNMDDCWSAETRDQDGNLQPDPSRFPHGMKALADYVHSKGLKIGVYTCVGTKTCRGGRPGSGGYFDQDAKTLSGWGIDFVKADNCHKAPNTTELGLYTEFSQALNKTGRPILFSLCEWGDDDVWTWGHNVGQMFRVQMDHLPLWHTPTKAAGKGIGQGTRDIIEFMATIQPSRWSMPYGFLDPDFLETLFHPTMSFVDSRTEFSFWSLWSSPLLVATNLKDMSKEKKAILMNPEAIAIDQDPLCSAGDRVLNATHGGQVWSKKLENGDRAVILFNPHDFEAIHIEVTWDLVGWTTSDAVSVRDIWEQKTLGVFPKGFTARVHPHDVAFLRVTKQASARVVM